jgi:hypothetical protein
MVVGFIAVPITTTGVKKSWVLPIVKKKINADRP